MERDARDQRDQRDMPLSRPLPPHKEKGDAPRVIALRPLCRKRTGSELLSRTLECSIIAAEALHDRVRDGNGCYVLAMATSPKKVAAQEATRSAFARTVVPHALSRSCVYRRQVWCLSGSPRSARALWPVTFRGKRGQASRLISTGKLNTLPCVHLPPIDPVVFRVP